MFTPNSRPMCIIGSSCTITSERYPAQSVQGAPVCARLTGEMLMCSTTPVNSTDSVDENARAERPSRCPPGGVRPRLSTAPRGARPEPHPRQRQGLSRRLGARLRRAGQSSRDLAPPSAARRLLASLTTLVLSLGFAPSAGAQTTTCGAPDLGGRTEVWSATLTLEHFSMGRVAWADTLKAKEVNCPTRHSNSDRRRGPSISSLLILTVSGVRSERRDPYIRTGSDEAALLRQGTWSGRSRCRATSGPNRVAEPTGVHCQLDSTLHH